MIMLDASREVQVRCMSSRRGDWMDNIYKVSFDLESLD